MLNLSERTLIENFKERKLLSKEQQEMFKIRLDNEDGTLTEYLACLILKDIDYLYFDEGYKYNLSRNELQDKEGEVLKLTKYEKGTVDYLVENRDKEVTVQAIIKNVWKYKPETSIFAIRNIVRSIRLKSCYSIIVNCHKKGYKLNQKKI